MKMYKLLCPFYDTRLQIKICAGEIFLKNHDHYCFGHSDGIHTTRLPASFVENNPLLFEEIT